MMKKFVLGFIALIFAFSGYVAMQPNDFRVSRSMMMTAPANKVFEQVNDQRKMEMWSPWAKLDPNAKVTFSGPEVGIGSIFTWSGNWEIGEGSMTIVESRPNEYVKKRLDFIKPMEATHFDEFTIMQQGEQVEVSWSTFGENNFIGKAMGIIFSCERTLGKMFEQGLANIKSIVEAK